MALKPTIYKLSIALSNLDVNYYDQLDLTVAQHPSETLERMWVRVLAYCLNLPSDLAFTAGLSTPNEPDIAEFDLQGNMTHWIDVGEPSFERIKKSCRLAKTTSLYTFNRKSDTWWHQVSTSFNELGVNVNQFDWPKTQELASLTERTMTVSMTLTENTFYISGLAQDVDIAFIKLC